MTGKKPSFWPGVPNTPKLLPRLDQWFKSERGQEVVKSQQRVIDELLTACFGYHLLQLSVSGSLQLFNESRVQQKYRLHPYGRGHDAISDFYQLPFENESLDVVILHHVQEFVESPHELLREIQRVIIPGGHLIVIGFNPWSLAGLRSRVGCWLPKSLWHNHLIGCSKMKDWLSLLGFETQSHQFGYHSPRIIERTDNALIDQFLKRWPLGDFFAMAAIKQVARLTPIKPVWRNPVNGFGPFAPAKPSVRNHSRLNKQCDSAVSLEELK